MAKIITLTFDDQGNPQIDTTGYTGSGCQAVQDVFGRVLGKTTKVVTKAEYNKKMLDKQKARG